MPIVFAAFAPHSPLLIEAIGKENLKHLKKTASAYEKLEQELYYLKPETLIIFSPHGEIQQNAFCINQCPEYEVSFKDFGDMATQKTFPGNVMQAHRIREGLETRAPLILASCPVLDYGTGVPAMLLLKNLPKTKIIPVYHSGLSLDAHFKFGEMLKQQLNHSQERIAVVASGDMSHRLKRTSPAGYSPKAKKFDQKIMELLNSHNTEEILNLNQDFISEACECGLKPLIMLLGFMGCMNYSAQLLSYESPFGIGYLVMRFRI